MGVRAALKELYNPLMVETVNVLSQGQAVAGGATSTSSEAVTLAVGNFWILAGMNVYDVTGGAQVGTVGSYTQGGTSLTLSANAASAIANGDVLQFGFTPSDLAAGETKGDDIRALIKSAQDHCSEAIAILNFLSSDVVTSGQDSAANTIIAAQITALS